MRKWLWAWCGLIIAVATVGVAYQTATGGRGLREVKTEQNVVALTFDDGPDIETTPKILKVLQQYNAKATFFVLGQRAEELPGRIAQIAYEQHEIGSHGYSHRWLTRITEEELNEEIVRTETLIEAVAPKPRLFRPPGAFYNREIVEALKAKGYTMVMWSVDSRDWARHNPVAAAEGVLAKVKPGSIVLLHDASHAPNTPQAVAIILERLSQKGYRFVTVSELVEHVR